MNPLPVATLRPALQTSLRGSPAVILSSPAGSGKSTLVPQFLYQDGFAERGMVCVLQPRRLPTRMLARRVASQLNSQLGGIVGYQIRMETRRSAETKILFITEGVLLRKFLTDPELREIQTIVLDEFHERHIQTDLAISLIRHLQNTCRPDLKLVVMSATLDVAPLKQFLEDAPVLQSEGRTFPVEVRYAPIPKNRSTVWDAAAEACVRLLQEFPSGDILVFQPGAREIRRTISLLQQHPITRRCKIYALQGNLSHEEQDRAVLPDPEGERKIIVSTNVAETSLTIDGITAVVDSGLARILRYDPHRGVNALLVEPIARANAEQRAGRAGRTSPGVAIRLWSVQEQEHRPGYLEPEIERIDFTETLLLLLASEINPCQLNWFCPPDPSRLNRAMTLLNHLGAIENNPPKISTLGRKLSQFPLHPRISRMLIEALNTPYVSEVADIAAIAESRSLLLSLPTPREREARISQLSPLEGSDFYLEWAALQYARKHRFSLEACRELSIHAGTAYEVDQLSRQILSMLPAEKRKSSSVQRTHTVERTHTDPGNHHAPGIHVRHQSKNELDRVIRRSLLVGFLDQLGVRMDRGTLRCRLSGGLHGTLNRETLLSPDSKLLVTSEIIEKESPQGIQLQLGMLTEVEEEWLIEREPHSFTDQEIRFFDLSTKSVLLKKTVQFRELVITEKEEPAPNDEHTALLLSEGIIENHLPLKQWDHDLENLIARLNFAHQTYPELELPSFNLEKDFPFLIQQLCLGAQRYREVHNKPILPLLLEWCSAEQWALIDSYTPERFKLPDGNTLPLRYENNEVLLSAMIQRLYDLKKHPTLPYGGTPIKVELLAPNRRPVQITKDLPNFWQTSYPAIRKELAGRYPKHEWR